ncbi:Meiotically up-regulated gene 180 protein [Lentinula edodes]|uniref:Meiotically up-regulated gene 180 protein n=1 Tax=Lentinula edodes TaxID=5353 RepID=A0A1Q3E2D0_LENED|nr:Meiotically up-regulated gene 180 protein [Lentinula edodes]
MIADTRDGKTVSLTWINYFSIILFFTISLPLACFQTVLAPFIFRANSYNSKTLTLQYFVGSGLDQYQRWVKKYQPELGALVVELPLDFDDEGKGERGRVFWIGPKRTEKVLLYFPGGAYMFQVTEMMLRFWKFAQLEWEKQGLKIGIAVLSYSVGSDPNAAFPTQLYQATQALEYLLSEGCNPSDIQIVGDSAGGNLVAQLLSHLVHPFPVSSLVPPTNLPPGTRLRGVFMISPWVSLSNPDQWGPTFRSKDYDVTVYKNLQEAGERYVNTISNIKNKIDDLSQVVPYAEPVLAPDNWYSNLPNTVVDRILVTAGKEERLSDQIQVFFEQKIRPYYSDAILLVQDGGIHDDVFMDFLFSDTPLENRLTPVVLEWIAKGFRIV